MYVVGTGLRYEAPPTKGSRFIADVSPIAGPDEAKAFIVACKAEFTNASHHCWAWRLGDGQQQSSDDGEPGGSAGRPILAQIVGHDVIDVVVVVSRWFGGTKLGVGGLVRAYGGAAGQALDRAVLEPFVPSCELAFEHAYADDGVVEAMLREFDAVVVDAQFGAHVQRKVRLPEVDAHRFITRLIERSAGRITASVVTT